MKATDLLNDLISSSGRRVDDSGIVVIRIHDCWDIRPVHGMADAWAATLGFGKKGGIQCAVDMGYPVIRVNHGTSEEPGAKKIAEYINEHYAGITAGHFPHVPYVRMVGQ